MQVMGFWRKAERVVYYKHQAVLDARKREAYDKQLDFLVDQTQRYSTLLAQRLTIGEGPRPLAPAQPLLHSSREGAALPLDIITLLPTHACCSRFCGAAAAVPSIHVHVDVYNAGGVASKSHCSAAMLCQAAARSTACLPSI